ncbi:MAG: DUF805 domain-containing protein [Pseudomonadota bacterium]
MIFQGRAPRAEFWWFFLFTLIIGFATAPLEYVLQTTMISTGVNVAFLLPTLAVGARRLHDTGRPGYLLAIPLASLPLFIFGQDIGAAASLIGIALLLLLLCLPGQRGPNKYGPDPLANPDIEVF